MISVNVNGTDYVLDFRYDMSTIDEVRCTTAMLISDENRKNKNYDPDYAATVFKHPKDRDVKELARKAAVSRLVRNFDRNTRRSIWTAYLNRK
jgi:hypothetical protein